MKINVYLVLDEEERIGRVELELVKLVEAKDELDWKTERRVVWNKEYAWHKKYREVNVSFLREMLLGNLLKPFKEIIKSDPIEVSFLKVKNNSEKEIFSLEVKRSLFPKAIIESAQSFI